MENLEPALLISANEKSAKDPKFGNVKAHIKHLNANGMVFWQIQPTGGKKLNKFKYPEIRQGYIYTVENQKFSYKFSIDFIKVYSNINNPERYESYVPSWRKRNWYYQEQEDWGYWILINKIEKLRKLYTYDTFTKYRTKNSFASPPQAYSIAIDPRLE